MNIVRYVADRILVENFHGDIFPLLLAVFACFCRFWYTLLLPYLMALYALFDMMVIGLGMDPNVLTNLVLHLDFSSLILYHLDLS